MLQTTRRFFHSLSHLKSTPVPTSANASPEHITVVVAKNNPISRSTNLQWIASFIAGFGVVSFFSFLVDRDVQGLNEVLSDEVKEIKNIKTRDVLEREAKTQAIQELRDIFHKIEKATQVEESMESQAFSSLKQRWNTWLHSLSHELVKAQSEKIETEQQNMIDRIREEAKQKQTVVRKIIVEE